MKKAKLTNALLPELLQRIAVFSMSSKDMLVFLRAFPCSMLSEPLKALLELFNALYERRLTTVDNEVNVSLWPDLQLPDTLQDPKLVACLEKVMVLIPVVDITDMEAPPKLPLIANTKIALHHIVSMKDFDTAIEKWHDRIQSLNLSLAKVSTGEMKSICHAIETLPCLENLEITIDGDFKELVSALAKSNVRSITLSVYHDRVVEWNYTTTSLFASWITEKPVWKVDLDEIIFSDECAELFFQALLTSPRLEHLYIAQSWKGQFLCKHRVLLPTVKFLKLMCCTAQDLNHLKPILLHSQIRHLSIANDPDVPDDIFIDSEFWTSGLSKLKHIRQLVIEGFEIGHVGSHAIASVLPQLEELQLHANNLDDASIEIIAKALPQCKRLTSLILREQKLTYLSAMYLADAIPVCKTLKYLDLGDNYIGSIGAYVLSPVLKYLDYAELSGNNIGFDGAIAIGQVLKETEHMLSLRLVDNTIQARGALEIIKALHSSTFREGVVDITDSIAPQEYQACRRALDELPDKSWCVLQKPNRYASIRAQYNLNLQDNDQEDNDEEDNDEEDDEDDDEEDDGEEDDGEEDDDEEDYDDELIEWYSINKLGI